MLLYKYTHVHVSIEFEMFMMRVFFTHSLLFSPFLFGGGRGGIMPEIYQHIGKNL